MEPTPNPVLIDEANNARSVRLLDRLCDLSGHCITRFDDEPHPLRSAEPIPAKPTHIHTRHDLTRPANTPNAVPSPGTPLRPTRPDVSP